VARARAGVTEKPIVFRTDRESRELMKQCGGEGLKTDERRMFEPGAKVSAPNTRIGRDTT